MQSLFVVLLVPDLLTVVELVDLLFEVRFGHVRNIIIVVEVTIAIQAATLVVSVMAVNVSDWLTSGGSHAHMIVGVAIVAMMALVVTANLVDIMMIVTVVLVERRWKLCRPRIAVSMFMMV